MQNSDHKSVSLYFFVSWWNYYQTSRQGIKQHSIGQFVGLQGTILSTVVSKIVSKWVLLKRTVACVLFVPESAKSPGNRFYQLT